MEGREASIVKMRREWRRRIIECDVDSQRVTAYLI
jgi:hypothetical protein